MCGIAGLFDFNHQYDAPQRTAIVNRFSELQKHRGPDASGLWQSENQACVLGHTRLSIIDLDPRSNQPMSEGQGRYVLSFNGEIYNYKQLRQSLISSGVTFKTDSDTEVLIEAYACWGDELFAQLDGMFALAIYDNQEQTLRLVRDRMGEKPLYVAKTTDAWAFSSELKPLLTLPGLSHEISDASLFEYFSLRYVLDPHTLFEDIQCVQPGCMAIINSQGEYTEKSYFAFDLQSKQQRDEVNPAQYLDALDNVFTDAVSTRLVADVPVGAFLSSGVDSSLVCAIAAKKLNSDVRCFSAGFVGGKENETDAAQQIADHLGLPFEYYLVSPEDMLQTARHFGELLDEPNGDRSCVPMYFLSRLVKSQVTVAVSGDGGDELFGGYGRYQPLKTTQQAKFNQVNAISEYFSQRLPVFPTDALTQAMPEQQQSFRHRIMSRFVPAFARTDLQDIERMRLMDAHSYMPGAVLAKVDRMSMRHSLEVRTPFFHPSILALSMQLPVNLSTDGHELKLILRQLLARYLPQHLIRPGKQGFGMPASFFQKYAGIFEELAKQADEILFDWKPMKNNLQRFEQLRAASRSNINSYWAWIVLGQWTQSWPKQ